MICEEENVVEVERTLENDSQCRCSVSWGSIRHHSQNQDEGRGLDNWGKDQEGFSICIRD